MNVGLARRSDVGAQPVARPQLARRLHPARLLHCDAWRQLRSDRARLPLEPRLAAAAPRPSRRCSGRATPPSAARSAATTGSIFTVSDTWSWSEVLSKTAGNHSLKFGGELRAMVNDQQNPTSSTSAASTSLAPSPSAIHSRPTRRRATAVASLLLGYPARDHEPRAERVPIYPQLNYREQLLRPVRAGRLAHLGAADVNAGLRWDYESPIVRGLNQQNIGFDPTRPTRSRCPGMPLRGGLLFASEDEPAAVQDATSTTSSRASAPHSASTTRR